MKITERILGIIFVFNIYYRLYYFYSILYYSMWLFYCDCITVCKCFSFLFLFRCRGDTNIWWLIYFANFSEILNEIVEIWVNLILNLPVSYMKRIFQDLSSFYMDMYTSPLLFQQRQQKRHYFNIFHSLASSGED